MDAPVPCPDCNPGIFICKRHLKECKARIAVICWFCKRELCQKHADCFCSLSESARDEVKTNKNLLITALPANSSIRKPKAAKL
jgi:hypothetical protein